MDATVMTCQKREYEGRVYYVLGVLFGNELGFISSRVAYKQGDRIKLTLGTDRDHKFVGRIADNG